jgi:glutamate dehydrogenase
MTAGSHGPHDDTAEILTRVAAATAGLPDGLTDVGRATLLRRYYRHVMPEDLAGRSDADLYGAALSHFRLAARRPQGTVNVRVLSPDLERDGWGGGRTVVEIVTDDMAFLVDSVSAELNRKGRSISLVIHPQIAVRRDITGTLQEIADHSGATRGPGETAESWMHVEIDRVADAAEAQAIEADLRRVLSDVRDAVEDWQKMGEAAFRVADDLAGADGFPSPDADPDRFEAWELLRWLADNHFTFLGFREYELVDEDGRDVLYAVPGTGLGILRGDAGRSAAFEALSAEARAMARDPRPLTITKSSTRSTVHRPAYLDFVGVKRYDEEGRVCGERRFLGLFSRAAYAESVLRIPVLRRKVDALYELTGFRPDSHRGRDLLEAVETYPRDELFQIEAPELCSILLSVLHIKERRRLRLFLRADPFGRFVSALVYLPRDRYNTENRLRMQDILVDELRGVSIDYTSQVSESVLARLHFVVRIDPDLPVAERPPLDAARIEARLAEATRAWSEDLGDVLRSALGQERGTALLRTYADAFPAGYREVFGPMVAFADIERLEALPPEDGLAVALHDPDAEHSGDLRFRIYRTGSAVSLSEVLPVLQHMGVEVTDERPFPLERPDGREAWVYDFGLRTDGTEPNDVTEALRALFEETFAAVRAGLAESDTLNRLVLHGGMTWRQVSVLRAYVKYMRQAGTTFGQEYIESVVTGHVDIARMLVRLFEARFSPELGPADAPGRTALAAGLTEEITGALDAVQSLDADRILRSLLTLVTATLRTNFFVHAASDQLAGSPADGVPREYLALKLDPTAIPELPAPRPMFEIWVYSPRVEGVHLRFGPVARGGLRWSDRREDFRTEVLGLVKAQMVKNAVIVPVGAKGGFVVKRPPSPDDRAAFAAEGVACYRTFIAGLLDLTDNLKGGQIVPAERVVRHDGDDAYLVVAADKGTARFSDIANSISLERGFWLGDAFASGGSVGYDHKAMGITARGAWESVKRHFRERGIDCQAEDFTCVGIGDMSGDVFGNGMLLSRHIRLVAAFDHRHVFLDPDPDAEVSFAERARLFALPGSSWADYDPALISPGGGVHPRSAKSIPLTPEVRSRLGIPDDVERMTPQEVIRAILTAQVDLLWNGGIGTYVKASTETNAEVGDKGNDAIRVDGNQLRAACVGEGGNLGFTQRGRIEYARTPVRAFPDEAGELRAEYGRINTDAIDNSAGVDCSDHEVNIKILLDGVVAAGDLTPAARDELLASMTEEVAQLVLRDNYSQNVALANSAAQSAVLLHAHGRYIKRLESEGLLDRELEFLPSAKEIAARGAEGAGLTAPELAVLLAYTKITLDREILASDLPDVPALRRELHAYFPTALREAYAEQIDAHPLRREILTTSVVNAVVNNAGITFVHRLREETAANSADIVRAHLVAREVFDLERFWTAVEDLDNVVPAAVQTRMSLQARRLAERGTRWLLHKRRPPLDITREVDLFTEGTAEVLRMLPKIVRGSDLEALEGARDSLVAAGVPHELAERSAAMDNAFSALDIVEVARDSGRPVGEVTEIYFMLADRLSIAGLLARINALPRDDRWRAMARASLREDLFGAHAALTADVLAAGEASATPEQRFEAWHAGATGSVEQAGRMFAEIAAADSYDLAMLSVAMRTYRSMLSTPRG